MRKKISGISGVFYPRAMVRINGRVKIRIRASARVSFRARVSVKIGVTFS
jgi:hypothetical protein